MFQVAILFYLIPVSNTILVFLSMQILAKAAAAWHTHINGCHSASVSDKRCNALLKEQVCVILQALYWMTAIWCQRSYYCMAFGNCWAYFRRQTLMIIVGLSNILSLLAYWCLTNLQYAMHVFYQAGIAVSLYVLIGLGHWPITRHRSLHDWLETRNHSSINSILGHMIAAAARLCMHH